MDIRGRMVSAPTISPNRFGNCPRSGSAKRNQWNTGDGRSRSGILGATERSEALSARVNTARPAGRDSKREAEPIRFAPRMSSGVSSRADHLKLPQTRARAQRGAQTASIRRSPAKTPVFARTCRQAGFGHQAAFSSTGRGAFFFAKTKKNGGRIPVPERDHIGGTS